MSATNNTFYLKKYMWKWFKNIFKKKDKEEFKIIPPKPKMDFSDIKFDLNIKSICYFEKLTGKSFFTMTDEDIWDMLYSIYMVNNPDKIMKREIFINILEREDIFKWFLKKYIDISSIWSQFTAKGKENTSIDNNSGEVSRITDYATTLIVEYGLDAHYVFYEMDVWELYELYTAIDTKVKKDLVNQRFWTYLNIMPHIDTKKCKSPQAFLPFDWEKDTIKKNKEADLNNNMFAIKNMLGKSIFKQEEKNE